MRKVVCSIVPEKNVGLASTNLCFPSVWISLPVDVAVQSSAYEIIFTVGGGEGSLET